MPAPVAGSRRTPEIQGGRWSGFPDSLRILNIQLAADQADAYRIEMSQGQVVLVQPRRNQLAWRGTPRILAVAAMLCLAAAVQAQNMFYREEAKDGRIYVFAQMAEYQRWLQSNGEMGKS